jgi:type 1 fimbriae regulatory protein FimB/type 1 fimbriae regulatory protein FimE
MFVSERLAPLSVAGYQRMVARAGEAAGFPFLVHSHMLRHSCGYKLANDGQDTRAIQHYLGHKSINSTVRYTALAPDMNLLNGGVLAPLRKPNLKAITVDSATAIAIQQ